MDALIHSVTAREILDSRGNPTVETTVILQSGYRGTASVPSGASVGTHEAIELRDGDMTRFGGLGVTKAIHNVNTTINEKLKGFAASDQGKLDKTLVDLDGTPNKSRLGANATLSVSMAVSVACANQARVPLYKYLNALATGTKPLALSHIPAPIFNIINGGKHGSGNLDFQEFHVIPATNKPYHEALQMGVEIYYSLKQLLVHRNLSHGIGDEGGFTPNLFTNVEALDILQEAIKSTRYKFGTDVFFGIDAAANTYKTDTGYVIKDKSLPFSSDEFIEFYRVVNDKYHLLVLEDPLGEDEWDQWTKLTASIGKNMIVVGDDLLVTNPERLKKAIELHACSGVLLKPNQIGTLSEFFAVVFLARQQGLKLITSHRSGETNDSFIADLAVAIQSDYIKFGAPIRGERVAKYNRLLQIESELRS